LRLYLMAFGIGALFAGVSGSIFARVQGSVSPDSFVVDQSFMVLAIVVLAGLSRRIWPVIIAAGVIIALPEALREFQEYRMLVFGPLLVAAVVIRENAHRFKRRGRIAAVPSDPDANVAPQPADLIKEETR